tara:strand:- start:70 stop:333 length:264 start_codon:yes stop_codon:yes gene_type:complete
MSNDNKNALEQSMSDKRMDLDTMMYYKTTADNLDVGDSFTQDDEDSGALMTVKSFVDSECGTTVVITTTRGHVITFPNEENVLINKV